LYKSGVWYQHDFFNGVYYNYFYYNNVYSGAIRESEGKWFYYTNSESYPNTDTLLYDFNLEIGDTLPETYTTPHDCFVVTDIDSILVNGSYKKQFYLMQGTGIGANVVIEGIGSDAGLLEQMCQFEFNWFLICYVENNISYWGASIGDCNLTVNIDELNTNKTELKIFPNPVKREDKFITVCNNNETGELRIFNCQGNLFKKIKFGTSTSTLVNISNLKSGIYIIKVNFDNGSTFAYKQILE
ncbi:MAG: T9SS type A sorting domain-containing protein, partial [Bacteroidales bacterium]|nr:T9SS type A sorting domain-containing protein [Bacteroidales bacterium]